jgi:hypothetical protein
MQLRFSGWTQDIDKAKSGELKYPPCEEEIHTNVITSNIDIMHKVG